MIWLGGWTARAATMAAPFDVTELPLPALADYPREIYTNRWMMPVPAAFRAAADWLIEALRSFCADCAREFATVREGLVRDLPGYTIGPHTDMPDRVATAILYLSGGNASGTTLYRRVAELSPGPIHRPTEDGFEAVATVLSSPGQALIFERTDESWHGVRSTVGQRDSLMVMARAA